MREHVRRFTTYKPERYDANDVHEDVPAVAQDRGVKRDERLWGAERENRVGIRLKHPGQSIRTWWSCKGTRDRVPYHAEKK